MQNIDVCKTLMSSFPNMWRIGLTFDLPFDLLLGQNQLHMWETDMTYDLELWSTDLNINRDHLLMKDYLPTKFEASEAKRSWVISCTRYGQSTWPLNLTFDLLTNRDHLLIWDYLPTNVEACRTKHCWVISCTRYRRSTWPLTLTFDLNINRDHLLIKDY